MEACSCILFSWPGLDLALAAAAAATGPQWYVECGYGVPGQILAPAEPRLALRTSRRIPTEPRLSLGTGREIRTEPRLALRTSRKVPTRGLSDHPFAQH